MGLLPVSVATDVVALLHGDAVWWTMAFWMAAAGVVGGWVAAAAGLLDFAAIPSDGPVATTGVRHMMLMGLSLGIFSSLLFLRGGPNAPLSVPWVLVLDAAALVTLLAGGFFGGELVDKHGVGRV